MEKLLNLCTCLEDGKSSHQVEEVGYWGACLLEDGGHTSFIVHRCLDCGGVCFFPRENGMIALKKAIPINKVKLAEILDKPLKEAPQAKRRNR